MSTIQSIPVKTIDGQLTSLGAFRGKVLLVVNVASKCGYTPQYEGLEALYKAYRDRGFEVLGFPANDFGAQEPGSNEEIASFCSTSYGVSFPMYEKVAVTGAEKHPLYAALIAAAPERVNDGTTLRDGLASFAAANGLPEPNELPELMWNFEKFLVGKDGRVAGRFGTEIAPKDPRLVGAIEAELGR